MLRMISRHFIIMLSRNFNRSVASFSPKIGMDGGTAAADVAYRMSEMSFIFPITPASPAAETIERWMSEGRKNIDGNVLRVTQMQSEGGAAGAIHGASGLGALTTTFTASQGLLLMLPDIYRMAGDHYPGVFHVAARTVGTYGISIYGDHSDIMCARASGAAMLSSSSVQEAGDFAAISHAASIKSSYPFIHFYDGFRTSHEINAVQTIPDDVLLALRDVDSLTKFKQSALSPDHPTQRGGIVGIELYWQFHEALNSALNKVEPNIEAIMNDFGRLTGRHYQPYEYYGPVDATDVIVAMGSGAKVIEAYIKYIGHAKKVGLVNIHMYRPFNKTKFMEVIPFSAKRICVMDKSKDILASGEPLRLEIQSIVEGRAHVLGGKYGIASKDFNPTHVEAVVRNMRSSTPKDRFSVGIYDDVTHTSLELPKTIDIESETTKQCIFWGFGSDGTVGACKDAIKIITNRTNLYGQGHFEYTAHKSGGITTSYLRFGPEPIEAPYLIQKADYIACHKPFFVKKIDLFSKLKPNGKVVFNSPSDKTIDEYLPGRIKRQLAEANATIYTIDASALANKFNLRGRINTIMQTVFFIIADILPKETALSLLEDAARHTYARKGQQVVDTNVKLIEATEEHLHKVTYDREQWLKADIIEDDNKCPPGIYSSIVPKMAAQQGNSITVSECSFRGELPPGETQFEKRGIAEVVPSWDHNKCVQCGLCSTICPHAVIRPFLFTERELILAPDNFNTTTFGKGDLKFRIQISPYDCTGCGKCSTICPVSALSMQTANDSVFDSEHKKWIFSNSVPIKGSDLKPTSVKNLQFRKPLLEFSGACGGCGETAIIKMLSQLYGDCSYFAFATGCPVVWGGSLPSNAFTSLSDGTGPAWSSSLFEDHAEFGFGQFHALRMRRDNVKIVCESIEKQNPKDELVRKLLENWDKHESKELARQFIKKVKSNEYAMSDAEKLEIERSSNFIGYKMQWIIGGDGWAYDIGYGGLDHILASGEPVKVIVLDTEVYSNTGGQPSKSANQSSSTAFSVNGVGRSKKDIALLAQTYGNVYVANTCLDANPGHTLKVLQEAVEYDGPALIVNYCPCIEHGLRQGLGNSPQHCKRLVKAGYLILSRFDPRRIAEGKNPLQLDSKKPSYQIDALLDEEVRFANLKARKPERAKMLRKNLHEDLRRRYEKYEAMLHSHE